MAVQIPVLASLSGYQPGWFRGDAAAGLAIAAVSLPVAIAYPALAGLPPQSGIYAAIAPLIGYAVFGPSRQLIVGPDAATMTVLAAVLTAIVAGMPAGATVDRVALAALLALGVGVMCFAGWALRLGVLASFLSRPILTGFFIGISFSILIEQIDRLTGVNIEAHGLVRPVLELISKAASIHWVSLTLGIAMFAVLQTARILRSPVPGPVIVVVVSVALSALFDFEGRGIAIVGTLPSGLPPLTLPNFAGLPLEMVALGSAAIFLVMFCSGILTARTFAAQSGEPVDSNRELIGFGAANIVAGFFGGFPVTGADSRTAINLSVGGRSQVAGLVAAAALLASLLFLGPALRLIPLPALGAILASTAIHMMDFAALRRLWTISRMEFVFALVAAWGPLQLGALNGVIIAVGLTLAYLLRKLMFPRDALLGRVPGREGFYKLHRTPDAREVPGFSVFLLQGSLLFFNADYVGTRLRFIADGLTAGPRWLVIDAGGIAQIDSTAVDMLAELADELRERGVRLGFAELHAQARRMLQRAGVIERIGPDMVFDILDDAYRDFEARKLASPSLRA